MLGYRYHIDIRYSLSLYDKRVASYPGSPAFIQLERNKEGNKQQKDA